MTEQTLLIVFIGLVTLALVSIAAAIGFVAWHVIKLLQEVYKLTRDVRKAGLSAVLDIQTLREKIKSSDWSLGSLALFLFRQFSGGRERRARKSPEKKEKK